MRIKRNSEKEIALLKESGRILVAALNLAIVRAKRATFERVTTMELEDIVQGEIRKRGGIPAFYNYDEGGAEPFPAAMCISLNNEIVHGIPKEDVVIKEGDLLSLDLGVEYDGYFTDAAVTLPIGKVSEIAQRLTEATRKSLYHGIKQLRDGARLGDYGSAVDEVAMANGFVTVKGLVGHGVGAAVHEPPQIPNYGRKGTGQKVKEGMVLALEPMLAEKDDCIAQGADGFAFVTADGGLSAHFEHTVLVTKNGCEIITDGIVL